MIPRLLIQLSEDFLESFQIFAVIYIIRNATSERNPNNRKHGNQREWVGITKLATAKIFKNNQSIFGFPSEVAFLLIHMAAKISNDSRKSSNKQAWNHKLSA